MANYNFMHIKETEPILLGVDVTDITYHPSLSLLKRLNSKDTSYVNPRESLTVLKSLYRDHWTLHKLVLPFAQFSKNLLIELSLPYQRQMYRVKITVLFRIEF